MGNWSPQSGSSLGEEATPGRPALEEVEGQDAQEHWNADAWDRQCPGSSFRGGWKHGPSGARRQRALGSGDVGRVSKGQAIVSGGEPGCSGDGGGGRGPGRVM